MATIPLAEQLACVERELRTRERVYPKWLQTERITAARAAAELRAMGAVRDTLRALVARQGAGPPQPFQPDLLTAGAGLVGARRAA